MIKRKVFSKCISIFLIIAVIFSCCSETALFVVNATANSREATYYIKYGGNGSGLSPESPLSTVQDVVNQINASGFTTGDTVYINVMQSDDWAYGANVLGAGGNNRADEHHITAWSANGWDIAQDSNHTATIVVQGYNTSESNSVYLAVSGKFGFNTDLVLGGPTIFKNITIVRMRKWRGLLANGFDVTYGAGTKFAYINCDDCESTFTPWNGVINESDPLCSVALGSLGREYLDWSPAGSGGKVEFANYQEDYYPNVPIVISNTYDPSSSVERYSNDVSLILDNRNMLARITWGNSENNRGNSATVFNKNLNLNIKAASGVEYYSGLGTVFVNGGFQIISSLDDDTDYSNVPSNVKTYGGKWFIKNNCGSNVIQFTDTEGEFRIKDDITVVATNLNDSSKTYTSTNGLLTLPAGKYRVDRTNIGGLQAIYYVTYGGNGDGRGLSNPASTVEDAIIAANDDGYSVNDTVYFNIIQSNDWNWGAGIIGAGNNYRADAHHITTWAKRGAVSTYQFNAIVQSADENNAFLATSAYLGYNVDMVMGGNTTFRNITIVRMRRWRGIFANGYDVSFGENSKFGCINVDDCDASFTAWNGSIDTVDGTTSISLGNVNKVSNGGGGRVELTNDASEVTVNISSDRDVWNNSGVTGPTSETETYSKDVNVVLNSTETNYNIRFGNQHGGSSLFEKNLNINIKAAKSITYLSGLGSVVVNGDFQFIARNLDESQLPNNITVSGQKWIIDSGDATGLLETTNVSGKYQIVDQKDVLAIDKNDSSKNYLSENGVLILPAGKYKLSLLNAETSTVNYYVQYGGDGLGLSPESPLNTVDDAVKAANQAGYGENDIVVINVMQSDDWNWGMGVIGAGDNYRADAHHITSWSSNGRMTSHTSKIVVQGYGYNVVYLASNARLGFNSDMVLGGNTEFKNITIVRMRRWRGIYANGYDLTFGKDTQFACINSDECNSSFSPWDGEIVLTDPNTSVSLGNVYDKPEGNGGKIMFASNSEKSNLQISSLSEIWTTGTPQGPSSQIEDYKNDVTIVYNHSRAIADIRFGNHIGGDTLFERNLNFRIKKAQSIDYVKSVGTVQINGGLQFITDDDLDYSAIPDNVNAQAGKWFIKNRGISDLIDFSETAGQFRVRYGSVVIATNLTTNQNYISHNGLLTIPQGSYSVEEIDMTGGEIDITVLIAMKKFLSGLREGIGSFSDYNSDGRINAFDLVEIKKYLLTDDYLLGNSILATKNYSGGADEAANNYKTVSSTRPDTIVATGKTYYVSSNGNDYYTGRSQSYPLRTIAAVNNLKLNKGDVVLFKRGDVFRTADTLELLPGVSYGAYGSGERPKILGSLNNYANNSLWTSDNNVLWKMSFNAEEAGNMVFNEGESIGVRKSSLREVTRNGDYYYDTQNNLIYLFLIGYNPGDYFDSIEISSTQKLIHGTKTTSDVIIENLILKYASQFAISIYFAENCSISGCEISWIGGGYQEDHETRFGNGIEFWCHAINCTVTNNYISQTYDAAITFQGIYDNTYRDVNVTDNLIEYSSMNFEFWAQEPTEEGIKDYAEFSDILFSRNILRFSGMGFGGIERENKTGQAFVLAWNYIYDPDQIDNFNITNNTFDCADSFFFFVSEIKDYINISNNYYYQKKNITSPATNHLPKPVSNIDDFIEAISIIDNSPELVSWF